MCGFCAKEKRINFKCAQKLKKLAGKLGISNYNDKKKKELLISILSKKSMDEICKALSPSIIVRLWKFVKRHKALISLLLTALAIIMAIFFYLYPRPISDRDIKRIAKANKEYLDKEYPDGHTVFGILKAKNKENIGKIVLKGYHVEGFDLGLEKMKITRVNADKVNIFIPKIEVNTKRQKNVSLNDITITLNKVVGSRSVRFNFKDGSLIFEVIGIDKNDVYIAVGVTPPKF